MGLCPLPFKPEAEEIEDADGHYEDGSDLSYCIAGKAHQERENGAAEDAHDEQAADFVLLFRNCLHGSRKDNAEGVAVAVAHQGHTCIDDSRALAKDEAEGGCNHHQNTDEQESPVLQVTHDETAAETAYCLCYEVDGADNGGIIEGDACAFHQYFRSGHTRPHINANMTDNGEEAKQYEGVAKQ